MKNIMRTFYNHHIQAHFFWKILRNRSAWQENEDYNPPGSPESLTKFLHQALCLFVFCNIWEQMSASGKKSKILEPTEESPFQVGGVLKRQQCWLLICSFHPVLRACSTSRPSPHFTSCTDRPVCLTNKPWGEHSGMQYFPPSKPCLWLFHY